MNVYLLTHGERLIGPNLGHTENGKTQITGLKLPTLISTVIVGTGARFRELYDLLKNQLVGIIVYYSPFAGSADSFDKNENLILADGAVVPGQNYIGLKRIDAFDPWKFVAVLPDRALILSGGELLGALGFENINRKASLYEINAEARSAIKIS